jgi:hypothetical protein
MRAKIQISTIFPPYLFWDMDLAQLDSKRDKDIIIPRALLATTDDSFSEDILKLESLYSKSQIISHLKSTKERISNEVCEMISKRYSIDTFRRFNLR